VKSRIAIFLGIALLAISMSPILARMLPAVPAVSIAFWRMASATMILWGTSSVKPFGTLSRDDRRLAVIAGVFLGFHFAFFFGALKLTTIANATVLGTMAPVFSALIERFFYNRKFNRQMILGLLVAILGAVVIHGGKFSLDDSHTVGSILALICSFWIAMSLLLAERVRQNAGTFLYCRTLYGSSSVVLIIIVVLMKRQLFGFSSEDYLWLGMLGLFPTVVGHTGFNYAVKYISPTIVAAIPLGEPVVASILGWIIFGESVGFQVIAGGVITLTGLFILITSKRFTFVMPGD